MVNNKSKANFYSRDITSDAKALSFAGDPNNLKEFLTETGDDDNLHIGQVVVNMGGRIFVIDNGGIHELEGEATGRGTSVFLQFNSEHGPIYETHYQFHKGSTYKHASKIGEINDSLEGPNYTLERIDTCNGAPLEAINTGDIWRD